MRSRSRSASSPTANDCWATSTPTRSPHARTSPPPTSRQGAPTTRSRSRSAYSPTRERLLGDEHPDTLSARANLAASYQQAGRTNDAITIKERVLADRERLLGDEHPDTLTRTREPRRLLLAGRAHQRCDHDRGARPRRPRATARRRAPRHARRTREPRRLLPAGRTHQRRDHDRRSASSPTANDCWATSTPTRSQHARTSPSPTGRQGAPTTRSRSRSASSPTANDCSATSTPTRSRARANLAVSYRDAGRTDEAIALEERVAAGRDGP